MDPLAEGQIRVDCVGVDVMKLFDCITVTGTLLASMVVTDASLSLVPAIGASLALAIIVGAPLDGEKGLVFENLNV